MRPLSFLILCIALFGHAFSLSGQGIQGQITDTKGEPIPYANIYVDEIARGTASDENGNYFLTLDVRGDYRVICSAVGYESLLDTLIVEETILVKNFRLTQATAALEEIVVSASKRDPAFAIIKKVVENKKKYLRSVQSYRAEVYVKATENIEDLKKEKKKVVSVEAEPVDPFEAMEQEKNALMAGLNMIEMQMTLNYQFPKKYKEERSAYKLYGNKHGLFVPHFGEGDFNFYRNQVQFGELTENTIISPISSTAILSYKYKLEASNMEGDQLVHKIKVIPRKKGNATVFGYLFINEGLWNINRLDLSLHKGASKIFDELSLEQDYQQVNDTLWLPMFQQFQYQSRQGKKRKFKGNTIIRYQSLDAGYDFPEKFFGNEIAVTTAEAYERDSTYWNTTRVDPLTEKERKIVYLHDSIYAVTNSKAYKDSMQLLFNKVTFKDIFLDGIGFRNHEKQTQIYFGSLPNLIEFSVIGGFRIGPSLSYFKRWENGMAVSTFGNAHVGLRNKDVLGNGYASLRYLPKKQGDIWINGGRAFNLINNFDAYLNQLRSNAYILNDAGNIGHRIELFNGLYLDKIFSYADRMPVSGLDTYSFIQDVITDEAPLDFERYQSFITSISLSYTPKQKYLTEPNRKVILGSSFPTFTIRHKKGWNNVFGSDIDFDYLEFRIRQNVEFGAFGSTRYEFQTGKFVNTKDLRFFDIKRFRESDPILYSDPISSFQALDTSLNTANLFLEFHHIHHFNGALINNIPLIKKTNVHVVAGAGILWVPASKLRHEEIFVGLERVFKLGPRRRFRIGVYGVLAESTTGGGDTAFKVSFDLIDTWKKDWSF